MATEAEWWRPPRGDVGLMLLLLVPSVAQVLIDPILARPLGVAYAGVSVLPVAWRRTHPVPAALVGASPLWIQTDGFLILGYLVGAILFYSVGAWATSRPGGVACCAWGLTTGTIGTLRGPEEPVAVFATWLVIVGSFVLGRLIRHERLRSRQLSDLTERLNAERAHAERSAVAEERARLARELHDVVGHEVTLIAIQSEAAAAALRVDPTRAIQPVEAIRQVAHRAGGELRAILGILEDPGDEPRTAPTMAGLEELTRRARTLGIDNRLQTRGTPWEGFPNVYLALNRVVRESLTNAGRHAPGAVVDIDLAWGAAEVSVTLGNDTAADPGPAGYGTRGMAERARLLGGSFVAGREDDGRYVVTLTIPRPRQVPS